MDPTSWHAKSPLRAGASAWGSLLDTSGSHTRLVVVVSAIFLVMSLASPGRFLSERNLTSMGFQFPELGIFALAVMLSLITGGIDLSVISIANLSGVFAALVLTGAVPGHSVASPPSVLVAVALAAALGTGIVCGMVNGWLISSWGITPILATLGTMQLYSGLCLVITKGPAIYGYPEAFLVIGNGTIGPAPVPLLVFLAVALATGVLLNRTELGVALSLVGTNETAARFSGIHVQRVLFKTYVLTGALAAIAGMVMIARANSAKADYGSSYLLQAVLVAILGGVDPKGGFGTVTGIGVAVLGLQFLSSGFNMLRFSNFTKEFAWGAMLLLVMVTNSLCHRIGAKLKSGHSLT
jgi:simple sugar transport system permease protein